MEMTRVLASLEVPVVQAPMAGGPSTPQLAAAVNRGGGLGFLAAGYLTAERMVADIAALRGLTDRAFGVNLFTGGGQPAGHAEVAAYAARLAPAAQLAGVSLGQPRFDDDGFDAKVTALRAERVPVVSFTFGLPPVAAVESLHAAGSEVWLTVTSPAEAAAAPKGHTRGEGQKPVSQAYKDNWNAIFAKKKKR